MRILAKKKKGINKLNILGVTVLICLAFVFVLSNRYRIYRAVIQVNGGSIYNDYLDAKFRFNSFFKDLEKDSEINNLNIEMGSSNYVKLQKERAKKTKDFVMQGGMIRTQNLFYKADIELGTRKSKSKVGLFGGASDNFRDSNGFHFRIKFDGNEGFGKKVINVLKPRSRGYNVDKLASLIHENLFNGIGIDYEPVSVTFNKSSFGIYLTEEYFDKYLLESKRHRESFIFKTMSKDSIKFKHSPEIENTITQMNLISEIISENNSTGFAKLIDKEKMFGYLALSFLFNQRHASSLDNLHFFHNSVTNKFEPIVREMNMIPINQTPNLEDMKSSQKKAHFLLAHWINFVGDYKFELGIIKALSRIKREMNLLLSLEDYLNFKNRLIGYKDEMNYNEEVMLQNLKKLNFLTNQIEEPIELSHVQINRDTIIYSDLIILKNEKFVIKDGLTITLEDNAAIIIYGQTHLVGSEEKPITIVAGEDSQSSIYINSKKESLFENVKFKNLSAINRTLWQLPSAITAYETNVSMKNCLFDSNQAGDDMVNFFRCESVKIENSTFVNVLSDAIDTDFSNVQILQTKFENIGNDAIDGSGSHVTISNCTFSKVEDKAISAGEASIFKSYSNTIADSELGLVCKDGSVLTSNNDSLSNNQIDLVMFVKKKFYKQPTVNLIGTTIRTNLIEKKVELNGLKIPKNISKGVKEKLYGNEFGKSSK